MKTIRLGKTGLKISKVGIRSIPNTRLPMGEAGKVIQRTLDLEVNSTATSGDYEDSEERIGKAIVGHREHVIISTKTWAADKATAPRR